MNNSEIMKVMNEKSNSAHVLIELNVLMFEWSFYVEKCGRRYTVRKVAELKNRRTYSVNTESEHSFHRSPLPWWWRVSWGWWWIWGLRFPEQWMLFCFCSACQWMWIPSWLVESLLARCKPWGSSHRAQQKASCFWSGGLWKWSPFCSVSAPQVLWAASRLFYSWAPSKTGRTYV